MIYPNREGCATKRAMLPSNRPPSKDADPPSLPHPADSLRALAVLEVHLAGRRERILHDVWTLRAVFGSREGPWRRAGFANRVLVRAASAELDRAGFLPDDPLHEAFCLLLEQRKVLNHCVVDERAVRVLFAALGTLRPSQQSAARRLLQVRAENQAHPDGGPATNLLLLGVTAGGLDLARGTESMRSALQVRFPEGAPEGRSAGCASSLVLDSDDRGRLDEHAQALDLSYRVGGRRR